MRRIIDAIVFIVLMLTLVPAASGDIAHENSQASVVERNVAAPRPGIIVINDDDGGGVEDHVKFYNRIKLAGIPVRVEGICVSACTLVFDLPANEVCVTETASFGFHLASVGGKSNSNLTMALVHRYYPNPIQAFIAAWILKHGPLTENVIYMSADEVIALGVFPKCGD